MPIVALPDPAIYRNRACRGPERDVFFPTPGSPDVAVAQALCAKCPRLRACAKWAAPVARAGALSDCVIAAVLLPGSHRNQQERDRVADALEDVAEHGAAADQMEGAA